MLLFCYKINKRAYCSDILFPGLYFYILFLKNIFNGFKRHTLYIKDAATEMYRKWNENCVRKLSMKYWPMQKERKIIVQ